MSLMLGESSDAGVEMTSTADFSAATSALCSCAAAATGVTSAAAASVEEGASLASCSAADLVASPVQNDVGRIVTFSHVQAR